MVSRAAMRRRLGKTEHFASPWLVFSGHAGRGQTIP